VKRRRHTPEQIVRKLREADRLLGEGNDLAEVSKALEVSEATFQRLKELERENVRLKAIVADQALENRALKEISAGNW
jgi:hypothetical protein